MWDNELELKFIEFFQCEPILWDAKHRYYKDKSLNHDAWNRLGQLMEMEVPILKKKKDSLFASYRKYRKMVNDSFRSGAGQNEIYKPVWFAYDALDSFLNQGLTPTTTINSTLNTGEPTTSPNEENRETTPTRNDTGVPQTRRPRLIQSEVNEAGTFLKEALSTFQENIRKRESQTASDDCEVYGVMLAKKLRAFSEMDRLEIMHEIDGLIINRRRSKQSHLLSSKNFIPYPSPSISSFSEPLPSERIHRQNPRISYPELVQIHIAEGQNTPRISHSEPVEIHIAEGQNTPRISLSEPVEIRIAEGQNTPRISYSEPVEIHIAEEQNTPHISYSEPVEIHIAEGQNPRQLYYEPASIRVKNKCNSYYESPAPQTYMTEAQNTKTDKPKVRILRNEVFSEAFNNA